MIKLYDYFRSTACYRVRIALNLKQLDYEKIEVHLTRDGGEQHSERYKHINPQGLVPCLEVNNSLISQSLAIIEYLEETFPTIPLLPKDPIMKANARSLALIVACEMHPLNNLRVLNQLKSQFQANEEQVKIWYHHWLKEGFDAFEKKLSLLERSASVCVGDTFSLADVCLIPQVFNAKRFEFPMDNYPLINQINDYCLDQSAFKQASPLD